MTNISLLSDISKNNKRTDEVINNLSRAQLIATYYVLKEDPTNQFKKSKEENKMKKFGSNISNRTKVLGGMTILLGAATIISGVKDKRNIESSDSNGIEDTVENIRDGIENAIEDITSSNGDTTVIDF